MSKYKQPRFIQFSDVQNHEREVKSLEICYFDVFSFIFQKKFSTFHWSKWRLPKESALNGVFAPKNRQFHRSLLPRSHFKINTFMTTVFCVENERIKCKLAGFFCVSVSHMRLLDKSLSLTQAKHTHAIYWHAKCAECVISCVRSFVVISYCWISIFGRQGTQQQQIRCL